MAQAPARPAAPAQAATFHIEGFRGARFGMTQDQVRAAILKDFSVKAADISQTGNALEHTTAVVVKVDKLDPGPGPAVITYIFGASKQTLMHINVAWTYDGEPSADQRRQIISGAVQLTAYFRSQAWPPNRTTGPVMPTPEKVVLFGGIDDKGGGVEVVAFGVPVESSDPKTPTPPFPKGPAQLLVSYSQDLQHPDVFKLAPGAF